MDTYMEVRRHLLVMSMLNLGQKQQWQHTCSFSCLRRSTSSLSGVAILSASNCAVSSRIWLRYCCNNTVSPVICKKRKSPVPYDQWILIFYRHVWWHVSNNNNWHTSLIWGSVGTFFARCANIRVLFDSKVWGRKIKSLNIGRAVVLNTHRAYVSWVIHTIKAVYCRIKGTNDHNLGIAG